MAQDVIAPLYGAFAVLLKARQARGTLDLDLPERLVTLDEEGRIASIRLRERFDLVIFMGVLYHLRHPLLALDLLREHVAHDAFLFQSMLRGTDVVEPIAPDYPFEERAHFERAEYPKLHFVEHRYAGDPTNWWVPNKACAEAMLRAAGFVIERNPEPEVYLCRAGERPSEALPSIYRRERNQR